MLNIIKFSDFRGRKSVKEVLEADSDERVFCIPVNDIKPNPNQVRKFFKREALDELTASVKKFGVCQPITVRYINNKFYELISGERRLMAAKAAGLDKIPALVLNVNDNRSAVLSLLENLQHQNLSFIEESEGFYSLKEDYGFTEEEIAVSFGLRVSDVNRKIRFMNFTPECRRIIAESGISIIHAALVLKIPDDLVRKSILRKIVDMDLSVQKTAEIVDSEIEKLKADDILLSEQKEKRGFSDMRLLTNSVKRSVELMNRSGIGAGYEVENGDGGTKIIISIPNV
ncbi:ParB/RepB/Spo0J family partition protein [Lachnospiraceae bacterium NSJ-143]|nr:ParB/RepB/Spo0J family partition protein [Lachnospiraceae bacterium NSJ-143]